MQESEQYAWYHTLCREQSYCKWVSSSVYCLRHASAALLPSRMRKLQWNSYTYIQQLFAKSTAHYNWAWRQYCWSQQSFLSSIWPVGVSLAVAAQLSLAVAAQLSLAVAVQLSLAVAVQLSLAVAAPLSLAVAAQ